MRTAQRACPPTWAHPAAPPAPFCSPWRTECRLAFENGSVKSQARGTLSGRGGRRGGEGKALRELGLGRRGGPCPVPTLQRSRAVKRSRGGALSLCLSLSLSLSPDGRAVRGESATSSGCSTIQLMAASALWLNVLDSAFPACIRSNPCAVARCRRVTVSGVGFVGQRRTHSHSTQGSEVSSSKRGIWAPSPRRFVVGRKTMKRLTPSQGLGWRPQLRGLPQ